MSGTIPFYQMFTKESCEEEMCVALARRVANSMFLIFEKYKFFDYFKIVPVLGNNGLTWENPILKIDGEVDLNLSDFDWDIKVKKLNVYKELGVAEQKELIADIQLIVEQAQSYFPYYRPVSEKCSFSIYKLGFFLKVGVAEESVVGFSKI